MEINPYGTAESTGKDVEVEIMQNEVSRAMEIVMIPIVGRVDDSLVEFDLEALYKAQPELALGLIRTMKGESRVSNGEADTL